MGVESDVNLASCARCEWISGPGLGDGASTGGRNVREEGLAGAFIHKFEGVPNDMAFADRSKVQKRVFELKDRARRLLRTSPLAVAGMTIMSVPTVVSDSHPSARQANKAKAAILRMAHSIRPRPTFLILPLSLSLEKSWSKMPLINPKLFGGLES